MDGSNYLCTVHMAMFLFTLRYRPALISAIEYSSRSPGALPEGPLPPPLTLTNGVFPAGGAPCT